MLKDIDSLEIMRLVNEKARDSKLVKINGVIHIIHSRRHLGQCFFERFIFLIQF